MLQELLEINTAMDVHRPAQATQGAIDGFTAQDGDEVVRCNCFRFGKDLEHLDLQNPFFRREITARIVEGDQDSLGTGLGLSDINNP